MKTPQAWVSGTAASPHAKLGHAWRSIIGFDLKRSLVKLRLYPTISPQWTRWVAVRMCGKWTFLIHMKNRNSRRKYPRRRIVIKLLGCSRHPRIEIFLWKDLDSRAKTATESQSLCLALTSPVRSQVGLWLWLRSRKSWTPVFRPCQKYLVTATTSAVTQKCAKKYVALLCRESKFWRLVSGRTTSATRGSPTASPSYQWQNELVLKVLKVFVS